jgi:hypothetical protein
MKLIYSVVILICMLSCNNSKKKNIIGKWEFKNAQEIISTGENIIPTDISDELKDFTFNFLDSTTVFFMNKQKNDGDTFVYDILNDTLINFYVRNNYDEPAISLEISNLDKENLIFKLPKKSSAAKFHNYKFAFTKVELDLEKEKEISNIIVKNKNENKSNKNEIDQQVSNENYELDKIKEYLNQDDINGFTFNLAYDEMRDPKITPSYEAKFSKTMERFSDEKYLAELNRLTDTIYTTKIEGNKVKLFYNGKERETYELFLFDFGVLMIKVNRHFEEHKFTYYAGYLFISKEKSKLNYDWQIYNDKKAQEKVLNILLN